MQRPHRFVLREEDFEHLILGGTLEFQCTNADVVQIVLSDIGTARMHEAVDVLEAAMATGNNNLGQTRQVT